ncbi:MAG: hypothetical protein R3A80_09295 [Bdellovibrionota bacterium]
MKHVVFFAFFFLVACEPPDNQNIKKTDASVTESTTDSASVGLGVTSPTEDPSFDNLASALRAQYIRQVLTTFSKLSIPVGEETCNLGQSLSVSLPGEITDAQFDIAFNAMRVALEECIGEGVDKVKLKAIDLDHLEADIQKALGLNIVNACKTDNDCAILPDHGYFYPKYGEAYSKRIQGLEVQSILSQLSIFMSNFVDTNNTDYTDYTLFIVEPLETPPPVPQARCQNNTCRAVFP